MASLCTKPASLQDTGIMGTASVRMRQGDQHHTVRSVHADSTRAESAMSRFSWYTLLMGPDVSMMMCLRPCTRGVRSAYCCTGVAAGP